MNEAVKVEIWSDIQCVWCYVGDARWRRAVERFEGEVEVVHRAFELQPGFPVDFDAQAYLQSERGLDPAAQQRVFAAMKQTAMDEGLPYEPEAIKPTNSHLALELLHFAESIGLRQQLSDRLYSAYFAEGLHIGTEESLVQLAASVGIAESESRAALESGAFRAAVEDDAATARALGARGVPFMVIEAEYAVPGAVATDELVRILEQVAAR